VVLLVVAAAGARHHLVMLCAWLGHLQLSAAALAYLPQANSNCCIRANMYS
jgi:hypothetical protein